jgi:hypothetical protein
MCIAVRPGCRRVDVAGGRTGARAVHVRSGAPVRGWPAPRHRHRGCDGNDGRRAGCRTGDVRRDGARERQERLDPHGRRALRDAHASRLARRCEGRRARRGCAGRVGRAERDARARRSLRAPGRPLGRQRRGLPRPARLPAGDGAAAARARSGGCAAASACTCSGTGAPAGSPGGRADPGSTGEPRPGGADGGDDPDPDACSCARRADGRPAGSRVGGDGSARSAVRRAEADRRSAGRDGPAARAPGTGARCAGAPARPAAPPAAHRGRCGSDAGARPADLDGRTVASAAGAHRHPAGRGIPAVAHAPAVARLRGGPSSGGPTRGRRDATAGRARAVRRRPRAARERTCTEILPARADPGGSGGGGSVAPARSYDL